MEGCAAAMEHGILKRGAQDRTLSVCALPGPRNAVPLAPGCCAPPRIFMKQNLHVIKIGEDCIHVITMYDVITKYNSQHQMYIHTI